jgi:hypothetical protein
MLIISTVVIHEYTPVPATARQHLAQLTIPVLNTGYNTGEIITFGNFCLSSLLKKENEAYGMTIVSAYLSPLIIFEPVNRFLWP